MFESLLISLTAGATNPSLCAVLINNLDWHLFTQFLMSQFHGYTFLHQHFPGCKQQPVYKPLSLSCLPLQKIHNMLHMPYICEGWLSNFYCCCHANISITRISVWSCFQTMRTEVEKRGAAKFFNESLRCLETWSNTSASVWYNFSNKYVLQEKTKEKVWLIYASVSSCFQTRHACDFPLS